MAVEAQFHSFLARALYGGEESAPLPPPYLLTKNICTHRIGANLGPRASVNVMERTFTANGIKPRIIQPVM